MVSHADAAPALSQVEVPGLERHGSGKVREIYRIDDAHLLMVATDRISAFDIVLPEPIPGKGAVLTEMSLFWFGHSAALVPNHLVGVSVAEVLPESTPDLRARAMVVRRLQPLPVEAIVRGYLVGSGWADYQRSGAVCGIPLPPGLRQAARLPEPLYTPSTKATDGAHDENIDYAATEALLGKQRAAQVRELSLGIYTQLSAHARARGIIIADTKLEFGTDESGTLYLIDEALTPDSSRFWPAEEYREGISPPSFDKQYVRDFLESSGWDKRPPAPPLPAEVIRGTAQRYQEAKRRLLGNGSAPAG